MKFVTFAYRGRRSWGLVAEDRVLDLGAGPGGFADLRSAIASGRLEALAASAEDAPAVPLADILYLPVIPDPGKILCVGHNYESHRQETQRDPTDHPSIFCRFADSQIGHRSDLIRPRVSTMLDYEGELAVIIGRGGRDIPEADAFDHVVGYSCYMDASVRDWQWHTRQFLPGKTFPGTGGFGPYLVTKDELPDPSHSSVTTRLNGDIVQSQPISDMLFPIPVLIHYISTFTPLSPGDVIVTGTPGGVGAKRQPPLWLKAGDQVEVDIPGVGILINHVADQG